MRRGDELAVHVVLLRVERPEPELSYVRDQQRGKRLSDEEEPAAQRRRGLADGKERVGAEARHENAVVTARGEMRAQTCAGGAGGRGIGRALELHVHLDASTAEVERLIEGRIGVARTRRLMRDEEASVCDPYVRLDAVALERDRALERRDRVLGGVAHGAAMPKAPRH